MIISKFKYFDTICMTFKGRLGIYHKVRQKFSWLPQVLKNHSVSIVSNTTKNCECLAAYKVRRGQQMFSFYKRLWGDVGFKCVVFQIRQRLLKLISERCRSLMLTGFCLSTLDWNQLRISDSDLLMHCNDIDYVKELTVKTMTCVKCSHRQVVDSPIQNMDYCSCTEKCSVYNKEVEGCPWIPFIERQHLLVWRTENGHNSGLYQYKVYGRYDDVRADIFLTVQVDTNYRKKWDPTVAEIKVVDSDVDSNSDIIYWEMLWPSFFSNRDYVFNRRFIVDENKKMIIIKNQITEIDAVPEYTDKVRVKDYWCTMLIKPFTNFDEPGLEFCMTYYDDPGLPIPSAVQTWVATSAMPDFLSKLRSAAIAYRIEYEKSPNCLSSWPSSFQLSAIKNNTLEERNHESGSFQVFLDAFCSKS